MSNPMRGKSGNGFAPKACYSPSLDEDDLESLERSAKDHAMRLLITAQAPSPPAAEQPDLDDMDFFNDCAFGIAGAAASAATSAAPVGKIDFGALTGAIHLDETEAECDEEGEGEGGEGGGEEEVPKETDIVVLEDDAEEVRQCLCASAPSQPARFGTTLGRSPRVCQVLVTLSGAHRCTNH